MARLQDYQTVTPSGSDKLLIVQSQGQGLSTLDNVVGVKMDKSNPTGTGSLSLNKASGSTLGTNAVAVGSSCTASGNHSLATGYQTTASGSASYSSGNNTIANHLAQSVFGEFNEADNSTAQATSRGKYVEIVGNGSGVNARSNARTLDWNGNEVLAGDLTIKGNKSIDTFMTASTRTAIAAYGNYYDFVQNGIYQESYYIEKSGFIFANMNIKCVTPQNDWVVISTTLPRPQGFTTINPPFAFADDGSLLPLLYQNGKLYAKGGTANKIYSISFSYPKYET